MGGGGGGGGGGIRFPENKRFLGKNTLVKILIFFDLNG
jgi:hypothetical protein